MKNSSERSLVIFFEPEGGLYEVRRKSVFVKDRVDFFGFEVGLADFFDDYGGENDFADRNGDNLTDFQGFIRVIG